MSIRARLVIMCLVVALLPAVPLTLLVQSLIDKSFEVGLSSTVENALQSGLTVSRERFDDMRWRFRQDVVATVEKLGPGPVDSTRAAQAFDETGGRHDGVIAMAPSSGTGVIDDFAEHATLKALTRDASIVGPKGVRGRGDLRFYETDRRTVQMAVWRNVLFFRQTDPLFLADADRLIEGRQIFAQLRLTRGGLTRSFFYPFIVIYAILVVFALALALFMAERLADPLRRLVRGTAVVAEGDWTHKVDVKASGETGQLVGAFNTMVARLDEQQRRLVDVEKMASWRDVARHLAHEIKNPLLPIRLTVEEIRDQYGGDDERYKEFLQESTRVVGDEVDHLQQLVRSFSSFAKMPELKPTTGSLEALVHDVARLYTQLEIGIDGAVPEFAFDGDQMRRVLTNLFDNVVSVAGEGAVVAIDMREDTGTAVLTFSDNGPGMPEETLARVFEPYFTTRAEGSGLGLAMLKNIVLLHGGTVDVESEVGRGTTFTIRLPLAAPPPPAG